MPVSSILPDEDPATSSETRRSALATAWQGLDRFKRSWLSIMILKAGIGLGQVVVLIVLLIMADVLPSPLLPGQKQSTPADACPRPQLFQAWMIVQIFRLTVCWMVSCWICTRNRRAELRQAAEDAADVEASNFVENAGSASGSPTRAAGSEVAPSFPSRLALPACNSVSSLDPASVPTPSPGSHNTSSFSVAQTAVDSSGVDSTATLNESKDKGVSTPTDSTRSSHRCTSARVASVAIANADTLRLAREVQEVERDPRSGLARTMDKWANTFVLSLATIPYTSPDRDSISKSLGLISLILFILGNVLLFYPLPTRQSTCYHAAPMLWWGVMTVTGVGWFLFLQMFLIMVIVGLGGHAMVMCLRRTGVLKAPPGPVPARPPQPDPLTASELAQLDMVCYIPAPSSSTTIPAPDLPSSRLPHRPLLLSEDQATCAICQEAYAPPTDVGPSYGRRIATSNMLVAAPLRLLPCGHVYHSGCIDTWLLKGGGNCPFCNRDVREMLRVRGQEKSAVSAEGEREKQGKKRWRS